MKFYARLHTVRKSFPEQFQDSFSAARTLCRQLDYPAFLCRPVTLLLASKMGPRRVSLAAGLYPLADSREAPACMRCRGLTGPQHAINLPIPRLIQALPDRHLANSPPAISGPPASRKLSGLPPRWPAVQVVNDFLLRAPTATQGLSNNLFKILFHPQLRDCYPP
jgi:hypothetical protein